jgi:hypothetical protein
MKNLLYIRSLTILIFVIIFLVGINSFRDYGIYTDDSWRRINDLFWYNYIKISILEPSLSFANNLEILLNKNISNEIKTITISSSPSLQTAPLGIFCEFFIDFFNVEGNRNIFQFRHLFNFIIYFVGLCFFYKLIYKRYKSYLYSFSGTLFLFLTPRLFGESFYNSQDISFLTLTIINIYTGINFVRKPNFKHTFAFAISSALSFNTRIMAIIPISVALFFFFFKCLRSNLFFKNNLKFVLYFLICIFFLIIIFWPFLWANPISNLLYAISEISSVRTEVIDLYFGKFILSTTVPSHYYIVWIAITSPLIIISLFLFGSLFFLKRVFIRFSKLNNDLNDMWRGDNEMYDIYFFMIILLSIILLIFKGLGYNGWRHLYFVYPSIIMISLYGLYLFHFIIKSKISRIIICSLILFNMIYLGYWNYKFHPYQHVYFNLMFKNKFHNNFEMDYWGLSNRSAIEYIINNNTNYPIKIGTKSFASLENSSLIFTDKDKKNFFITHELSEADFVITNYMPRRSRDFIIDKKKYKKYYEVLVDNKAINTVYKKIK